MNLKKMLNDTLNFLSFNEEIKDEINKEKVEFEEFKLKGSDDKFEISSLEEGGQIFLITEDGNIPVEPGDYELEDGTILTVEETGVIKAVKKDESDEDFSNEDGEISLQEEFKNLSEKMNELSEKIDATSKAAFNNTKMIKHIGSQDLSDKPEEDVAKFSDYKDDFYSRFDEIDKRQKDVKFEAMKRNGLI